MTSSTQQAQRRLTLRRAARILAGYGGALLLASFLCTAYAVYDMNRLFSLRSFQEHPFSETFPIWMFVSLEAVLHSAVQSAVFIIIGEWKAFRSAGYYTAMGAVAGIVAWLTYYARLTNPVLIDFKSFLALGIVAGAGGGLVYWWIAGRRAGEAWRV